MPAHSFISYFLSLALLSVTPCLAAGESFPVTIQVDVANPLGELKPIWRFFGADEPNYATMKDGRKLLHELGALAPKQVYFRAHNLLTSGDGKPALKWGSTNVYTEDAEGRPIYDWTLLDEIFTAYLENGVKPLVQLGFMPEALSTNPQPYRHHWTPEAKYGEIFTGWTYPPKDYAKWGELCYQLAKHCVEKFGREEVETWWWQPWNEYNGGYWKGSFEDYHKLYDYSAAGVRKALPNAKFGGPSTAAGVMGGALEKFLNHSQKGKNYVTGETGTPLDMISFHAKGGPKFVDGHIRMDMAKHLREIDEAFALIASYPNLRKTPIILTESDPEGCAACQGPRFSYRNGTVYSSYTAASFARKQDLAAARGVNLEGALTWAFEFENLGHFPGFRVLASQGIDHPVLNVFRMFSKMSGQRLQVTGNELISAQDLIKNGVLAQPDVSALASLDANKLAIMLWHYHDDDLPGPDAAVTLKIPGLSPAMSSAKVTRYLIDETHSNAFTVWKLQGEPAKPSAAQYAELEQVGQLAKVTESPLSLKSGEISLTLPRQAVSLLVLEW
jgi:xylan 1,4-beta-xylosidase